MKQTKIFWGFLLLIITLVTGCSKEDVGNNDSVDQDPGLYYQIDNGAKTLWDAETFKSALTSDVTVSFSTAGTIKMDSTVYKKMLYAINSTSRTGLTLDFSRAMAEEDAMARSHSNIEYNGIKAVSGFPAGITSLEYAFGGFTNLTSIAEIPNSVTNMRGTFAYCTNFNQQITIPNSVINMEGTFINCTNLNQQITIPNSVIDMGDTFMSCTSFNQPITIPESVTNMNITFWGCISFNQPITIPNSVTDMTGTFLNCISFNQPITISNSVTNMMVTFLNCTSFNQPITIPNSVTDMSGTFYGCPALASTVTIYGASDLITTETFDGPTNTANIDLILGSERTEWTEGNTWEGKTFKSITRAKAQ